MAGGDHLTSGEMHAHLPPSHINKKKNFPTVILVLCQAFYWDYTNGFAIVRDGVFEVNSPLFFFFSFASHLIFISALNLLNVIFDLQIVIMVGIRSSILFGLYRWVCDRVRDGISEDNSLLISLFPSTLTLTKYSLLNVVLDPMVIFIFC